MDSACRTGQKWRENEVEQWIDPDDGLLSESRGCTYAVRFLLASDISNEVTAAFSIGCDPTLADACDESLALAEDVVWSDAVCRICIGTGGPGCLELLDPSGRC